MMAMVELYIDNLHTIKDVLLTDDIKQNIIACIAILSVETEIVLLIIYHRHYKYFRTNKYQFMRAV